MFSLKTYVCFENVLYMATYIVKMGGLERLPKDMGFVSKLSINIENFFFNVSRTLHACARSSLRAHASWLRAQVDSCMRMPRASLALLFQK